MIHKYRGLTKDGKWVKGDVHFNADCTLAHIHKRGDRVRYLEVLPETVGQYTGLKDKNGVKGYFGEIAKHDDGCFGVVKWDDRALRVYFDWDDKKRTYPNPYSDYIDFVFVGNIHQNPELLENK